jgi:hypothetical protein
LKNLGESEQDLNEEKIMKEMHIRQSNKEIIKLHDEDSLWIEQSSTAALIGEILKKAEMIQQKKSEHESILNRKGKAF